MNKLRLLLITLFIVSALIVPTSSCKYKNGPLVSFRTRKARLDGTWKLEKEFINGKETKGQDLIEAQQSTGIMEFTKDGDFILQDPDTKEFIKMKWEFSSDKKKIKFIYPEGDYSYAKILRLKNNSLWLKEDVGTSTVESHYVPA